MTLLAFHVWNGEIISSVEANHEILFAESAGKAKYNSEAYAASGEYTQIRAKRMPEFDQYANLKYVPVKELLERGWMFECDICFNFADNESALVIDEKVICEECQEQRKEG